MEIIVSQAMWPRIFAIYAALNDRAFYSKAIDRYRSITPDGKRFADQNELVTRCIQRELPATCSLTSKI